MDEIMLETWIHPSMPIPFKLKAPLFVISTNATVGDLMDKAEAFFRLSSEEAGAPKELQIKSLWNIKNKKKGFSPDDEIGKRFVDGDTFCIYGDIVDAETLFFKTK